MEKQGQQSLQIMPPDLPERIEIKQFLKKLGLGIPYHGQGLPSVTYEALLALLRKKERQYRSGEEKCAIQEQVGFECQMCGAIIPPPRGGVGVPGFLKGKKTS